MPPAIQIRPLHLDEVDEACALARDVFDRFVAPGQIEKGIRMFHRFVQPAALLHRHTTRYTSWIAVDGPRVVGLLHLHACNHISLFFVAPEYQGRGYAAKLFHDVIDRRGLVLPATVNSSPNAVGFYAKLGFAPTGPEKIADGVRFQPMRLPGRTLVASV